MNSGAWTEIFKAGDYGAKGVYTEADLDKLVQNFNAEDQVPIVVGHPATDSPAWGWIAEVKRHGSVLLGRIGELHQDFAAALAQKKFKNRSVRIARTPSGPKLLHLGYLGAALPQVEGLKQAAQFAGDGDCIDHEFALQTDDGRRNTQEDEEMDKDERIKQLEADLAAEKAARTSEQQAAAQTRAAARKDEFSRFVETEMVATGKIAAERKNEVVSFMESLPDGEQADFSVEIDGTKRTISPADWFKGFVRGLPAADFTRDLPAGPQQGQQSGQDFVRDDKGQLVDLARHV
jgi:hypothetical protein